MYYHFTVQNLLLKLKDSSKKLVVNPQSNIGGLYCQLTYIYMYIYIYLTRKSGVNTFIVLQKETTVKFDRINSSMTNARSVFSRTSRESFQPCLGLFAIPCRLTSQRNFYPRQTLLSSFRTPHSHHQQQQQLKTFHPDISHHMMGKSCGQSR